MMRRASKRCGRLLLLLVLVVVDAALRGEGGLVKGL